MNILRALLSPFIATYGAFYEPVRWVWGKSNEYDWPIWFRIVSIPLAIIAGAYGFTKKWWEGD